MKKNKTMKECWCDVCLAIIEFKNEILKEIEKILDAFKMTIGQIKIRKNDKFYFLQIFIHYYKCLDNEKYRIDKIKERKYEDG